MHGIGFWCCIWIHLVAAMRHPRLRVSSEDTNVKHSPRDAVSAVKLLHSFRIIKKQMYARKRHTKLSTTGRIYKSLSNNAISFKSRAVMRFEWRKHLSTSLGQQKAANMATSKCAKNNSKRKGGMSSGCNSFCPKAFEVEDVCKDAILQHVKQSWLTGQCTLATMPSWYTSAMLPLYISAEFGDRWSKSGINDILKNCLTQMFKAPKNNTKILEMNI